MADVTIGSGFVRTPEQEAEIRRVAATLPATWKIELFGSPTTGIFSVRTTGPDIRADVSFGPDGCDSAIQYLRALRRGPT